MQKHHLIILALLVAVAASAQVPVVGEKGVTLQAVSGTPTLVTVVLKDSGAQIPNLRIKAVHSKSFTAVSEDGKEQYYLNSAVKEVRLQGGLVKEEKLDLPMILTLTTEQQQAVKRAAGRAAQLFQVSADNQSMKMTAASLMIVAGEDADVEPARNYLQQLADSNSERVAFQAGFMLFLAGSPIPETLVMDGMSSGDPLVRSQAAMLAGLQKNDTVEPILYRMVQGPLSPVLRPRCPCAGTSWQS